MSSVRGRLYARENIDYRMPLFRDMLRTVRKLVALPDVEFVAHLWDHPKVGREAPLPVFAPPPGGEFGMLLPGGGPCGPRACCCGMGEADLAGGGAPVGRGELATPFCCPWRGAARMLGSADCNGCGGRYEGSRNLPFDSSTQLFTKAFF